MILLKQKMMNSAQLRPYAILISVASCAASYVCDFIAFQAMNDMGLTGAFFLGWVVFSLIALGSAPFALLDLWRSLCSRRHLIPLPALGAHTDRRALQQNAQRFTSAIKATALRHGLMLTAALNAVGRFILQLLRRVAWPKIGGSALWIFANIAVTLLPVILTALVLFIHEDIIPRRSQSHAILLPVLLFAQPFIFTFGVAIKTKFDMTRIFTYSPAFLFSFGKKLMIAGPIFACLGVAQILTGMKSSEGWEYLLAPIAAVAIILHFIVTGGLMLLLGKFTQHLDRDRPLRRPNPNHVG